MNSMHSVLGRVVAAAAVTAAFVFANAIPASAAAPAKDTTPPAVTSSVPAAGATSVDQAVTVKATFSERVSGVSTTSFTLKNGTAPVAAAVKYTQGTSSATLTPSSPLAPDTKYTANLSNIVDSAGNAMAAVTWTFTTGPAPTITSQTPASGATGVKAADPISMTFSEPVTGASSATVTLSSASGSVASSVSMDSTGKVLTLQPTATLADATQYTVSAVGGTSGIKDLVGNPFVTTTWSFTTAGGAVPLPANAVTAFIGDSYTAGGGSSDPSTKGFTSDLSRLRGWTEKNVGRGGTGYVATSGVNGCGLTYCPSYPEMVSTAAATSPNLVIVSGGRNDIPYSTDSIHSGASTLFANLAQQLPGVPVIVTSPIWDAGGIDPRLAGIQDAVKTEAAAAGVRYLDIGEPLAGHPEYMSSDGVHPNDLGHQAIADAINAALG